MTKEISDILRDYINYYQMTRQVGHTRLMNEGLANSELKPIILSPNYQKSLNKKDHAIINVLNTDELRGRKQPLAWDNAAIELIFIESLNEIRRLETLLQEEQ